MKSWKSISVLVAIGLCTYLLTQFNNCGSPANTLTQASNGSDFPKGAYVWRPDRLSFISCTTGQQATVIITNGGKNYAFPTFMAWQNDNPGSDTYSAGLQLSKKAQEYITKNKTTVSTLSKILPEQLLTLTPIANGLDSSTEGWYPNVLEEGSLGFDLFNVRTDISTIRDALANGKKVKIGKIKSSYLNALSPKTYLGFLFHDVAESEPRTMVFDQADKATTVAGEALEIGISGRGLEPALGSSIYPYSQAGRDEKQAIAYKWKCDNYLFFRSGDTRCNTTGSQPTDLSELTVLGRFGTYTTTAPATFKCFVPYSSIKDKCYDDGNYPIDLAQNAAADEKPDWYKPENALYAFRYKDATDPHWITACRRQKQ